MGKFFSILLAFVMLLQIIRPLGYPGLRHRSDAWKIAFGALILFGLTALIRPA